VAPNGRVDVCWLDSRNDATAATSQLYYSYSTDGGVTFVPNIQISPAFNSTVGWPQQNKIGDYMAITADNTAANIVYPATFNGEQDIYYVRVPQPIVDTVKPDAFSLFRGKLTSGQLSDLYFVDANYLVGRAGIVANITEPPLQVIVDGTSAVGSPVDLLFTVVSKASATALQQQTLLFNYQSGQYELFDSRATTLADQTVVVHATGDLSRFVNQADKKVRAKITIKQVGIVPAIWSCSLNQTVWTVTH